MSEADARSRRVESVGFDFATTEKEHVRVCNLCRATTLVEIARRDRYGYPSVLWLCGRCGLAFLSPRLTQDAYARFYERVYRPLVSAYHGRTIDATTVQDEQRDYAAELLEFLRQSSDRAPMTILDIGGSTGVVGGTIGDAPGAKVTVIDPSPDELAVAESRGLEAVHGFAEDFDPRGRDWDLVLLCQTIDHLLDPAATLRAITTFLAPAGRAFVDVLDVGFVARRRGCIEGASKVDHPFYLTRETARAYFAVAGLVVLRERLSDDGHWGFLLERGRVGEPDWAALTVARDRFLAEVSRLRAVRQ